MSDVQSLSGTVPETHVMLQAVAQQHAQPNISMLNQTSRAKTEIFSLQALLTKDPKEQQKTLHNGSIPWL